jgi:hypothetical protein
MAMKTSDLEFFRPFWRRAAVTLVIALWFLSEALFTGHHRRRHGVQRLDFPPSFSRRATPSPPAAGRQPLSLSMAPA